MTASSSNRSPHSKSRSTQDIGILAEAIVAQWLIGQGWQILQRRWHCRWGELDLIAQIESSRLQPTQAALAFVEVKARSSGNWDNGGLLAITPQKQAKLWQAAQFFLADRPHLADLPCRFDVALVKCQRSSGSPDIPTISIQSGQISVPVELGKRVPIEGYRLTLQHYIPAAFD